MKKISLILVLVLVCICGLGCISFAEPTGDSSFLQSFMNILDKVTIWALPVCAVFLVIGAVQFFILGIRNLYKKKQGLLLMFGSMTFYVIITILSFVLTLAVAGEIKSPVNAEDIAVSELENTAIELGDTTAQTVVGILKFATEWSLPFCAILAVFGAAQYYVMGIRNLYKKRQGLLLMFGSIAFFVILVVVNFIITRLIG